MSTKKLGLLPRLIIAIVAGILIGNLTRSIHLPLPVQILATFNGVFGNFLSFIIPLIILGFVIPGIADLGSDAGKLLAITAGIACGALRQALRSDVGGIGGVDGFPGGKALRGRVARGGSGVATGGDVLGHGCPFSLVPGPAGAGRDVRNPRCARGRSSLWTTYVRRRRSPTDPYCSRATRVLEAWARGRTTMESMLT